MVSKEEILARLMEVTDPELGLNIVDLGLIYDVDVRPREGKGLQKVFIKMTFTTPACPLMNDILDEIKAKLERFEDADIEVSVVFEPLWSAERLSERAKIKLGLL
jgi:metal-sulfur cluster biosynthetic enzyme